MSLRVRSYGDMSRQQQRQTTTSDEVSRRISSRGRTRARPPTSRRVSRIQRRTSCMRAVRRRDQLSPRSNARWKNPLPRMCRRELLRAVVKCPAFLAATPEDHVKLHVSLRGARTDHTATHGSRRGLHSCAAARLPTRGPLHSRMSVSRLMQKGPATCHKNKIAIS